MELTWILLTALLMSRFLWLILESLGLTIQFARFGRIYVVALAFVVTTLVLLIALWNRSVSLSASWYLLWIYLIFTWVINMQGHLVADVLLIIFALVVYFVLEGWELAVTELLDKDVDQFGDKSLGNIIKEITGRKSVFYDCREWIVIVLALTVTLRSDFPKIRLPLFTSATSYPYAHVIFSIFFATFSIIWVSQIPPKQFALNNSQAFLKTTGFTFFWPFLRACGGIMERLRLHAPAELVKWLFKRSAMASPIRLRPSDVGFFEYGLSIYGYGYHKLRDQITVSSDGGGKLTQRGVYYIVDPSQRKIAKTVQFDSDAKMIKFTEWAYYVPTVDLRSADDLRIGLDMVFADSGADLMARGYSKYEDSILFSKVAASFTPRSQSYEIAFPGIRRDPDGKLVALAIGFEIEFRIDANCFKRPTNQGTQGVVTDYWRQRIGFPWRLYELHLSLEDDGIGRLVDTTNSVKVQDIENTHERQKISCTVQGPLRLYKQVKYPILGAVYNLNWQIWPNS